MLLLVPGRGAIDVVGADVEIYDSIVESAGVFGIRNSGSLLVVVNTMVVDGRGNGVTSSGGDTEMWHVTVADNAGSALIADSNVFVYDSIVVATQIFDNTLGVVCPASVPVIDNVLVFQRDGFHFSGLCAGMESDPSIFVAEPNFVAPRDGDFTPGPGSLAVDKGFLDDWVEFDIFGRSRSDGDGDGTAQPDLGAIEAPAA